MFEVAELGNRIDKQTFKAKLPALRIGLLQAQQALRQAAEFPVIVLISGVDGAGKGDTLNVLNEWMDPRYLRTVAFGEPTDEEWERPGYWRYWRSLPPKGSIGLYVGSWYSDPIAARVRGDIRDAELDRALMRIKSFEKALVDDGALVIKFWLHLSHDAQKRRLKALAKEPDTAWRVTDQDRKHLKLYARFRAIAERALRETGTGDAPWLIVEGEDPRYRHLTVAEQLLDQIMLRLAKVPQPPDVAEDQSPQKTVVKHTLLGQLDLGKQIPKAQYRKEIEHHQARLGQLVREAKARSLSSLLVLEGWDAAGKGGIIRRIVPAIDARNFQVIPIAAPTDEERAHHWLWRFWRHIPRAGFVTIYDRSWYGRVLVERVEGFARHAEWMRAYGEINDFEEQLTEAGIVLLKFWVHISKDEQLARFKAREQVPWKQYKITEEDYRNREHWGAYEQAVEAMIERTGTQLAPWILVEGNDKRYARIKVLHTWCERLEAVLG